MVVMMVIEELLLVVFAVAHNRYREENQIHVGHSVTERFSIYSLFLILYTLRITYYWIEYARMYFVINFLIEV